ncbi:MAG TPA: amino acid ABC transporter permease [Candidatus Limnocylindrales bacterium]
MFGFQGRSDGRPARRPGGGEPSAFRSTLIALASTVVFFGALAWIVVSSPGWPAIQRSFLNGRVFAASLPSIVGSFAVNVQLFLIAEVLILALGLVIAVLRSLPGPVFFPVRLVTTIYVDVFRALPGVLVIYILGFGIPGLGLAGVPIEPFFYAVVALTLIYSAYVSEVYRAGIESIHPSQDAAARSLGLSRFQSLRYVILPQAVRRVVPPLLNDFIGLQKDTVLVSYIGVVEIFRQSYIKQAGSFNFTPYLATALVFLVVTIPLARLTDWLIARESRRRQGGAALALTGTQGRAVAGGPTGGAR